MGLDFGLHKTGRFEVLACVEREPIFCDTIRANIAAKNISSRIRVYETDIKALDPLAVMEDLALAPGELDLLVGGPPCQSFSTAGRRGTVQDPRGTLIWDFIRFLKVLKPKAFLMENVRGLMSAALHHRPISQRPGKGGTPLSPEEEPGSVVRLLANDLAALDGAAYRMDVFEVNAVNYGAPQLRERVLFIGNRYNKEVDFPDPTHGTPPINGEQIALLNWPKVKPWRTLGEALKGLIETTPSIMDFSPRKKHYLSLVPTGGNWRHLPLRIQMESMGKAFYAKGGRSGWWRRLSYDLPCPTLVTMPNHASTALCHPVEVRALSVREYCRIQEFPDSWVVCGAPVQQYAQIGNAVPVRLGEVAGEVIANMFDGLSGEDLLSCGYPLNPYRKVYIQSHVRTRQWFREGKAFKWSDGDDNGHAAYRPPKTVRSTTLISREDPQDAREP
jgi:DNA (cytosine-5)-methyltransferase 1